MSKLDFLPDRGGRGYVSRARRIIDLREGYVAIGTVCSGNYLLIWHDTGRSDNFMFGMIASEDVSYFMVVVMLFLLMTIIRLQGRRQKVGWLMSLGKYAGVWGLAVVLAFMSSRPVFKYYYDATHTKANTLTPNSQEIINKLTGIDDHDLCEYFGSI